jgi:hypothetical protein
MRGMESQTQMQKGRERNKKMDLRDGPALENLVEEADGRLDYNDGTGGINGIHETP